MSLYQTLITSKTVPEVLEQISITEITSFTSYEYRGVILYANDEITDWFIDQLPSRALESLSPYHINEIAQAKKPAVLAKLGTKGLSLANLLHDDAQRTFKAAIEPCIVDEKFAKKNFSLLGIFSFFTSWLSSLWNGKQSPLEANTKPCTPQDLDILRGLGFPFSSTTISAEIFLHATQANKDWIFNNYDGRFFITTPEEFLELSADICLPPDRIYLRPSTIINANSAELGQITEQLPSNALVTLTSDETSEIAKTKKPTDLEKLIKKGFSLSKLHWIDAQNIFETNIKSYTPQELDALKNIEFQFSQMLISAQTFLSITQENQDWIINNHIGSGKLFITTPEEFLELSTDICLSLEQIHLRSSVIINANSAQLNQITELLPDNGLADLYLHETDEIIATKTPAELEKLATKGFSLPTELQEPFYSTLTTEKQYWFLSRGGQIMIGACSLEQLANYQNIGLLPCFEEIPKTLNYIWLVDTATGTSKDLLNGKHKDDYIKNLEHNAQILHGYKQILWTNCKQCIPVTVQELEERGFEIRELNQLPHLDNPKRACIASKLEQYNKAVSASFIDILKVMVTGIIADLNYKFYRALTPEELKGGFITPNKENYFLGISDSHPITTHLVDWFYTIACIDTDQDFNEKIANHRNSVFSGLGPALQKYPNIYVKPGDDNQVALQGQTYYSDYV